MSKIAPLENLEHRGPAKLTHCPFCGTKLDEHHRIRRVDKDPFWQWDCYVDGKLIKWSSTTVGDD